MSRLWLAWVNRFHGVTYETHMDAHETATEMLAPIPRRGSGVLLTFR